MNTSAATACPTLPPRPTHELVTVHKGEIVGTGGSVAEIEINLPKIVSRRKARGVESFTVRSRTSDKTYTVTRFGSRSIKLTCTCPAGIHGRGCHHKRSVRELLTEESKMKSKPEVIRTKAQSREEVRREASGLTVKVPYEKKHFAKQLGGLWNSQTKMWMMPSRAAVTMLEAALID